MSLMPHLEADLRAMLLQPDLAATIATQLRPSSDWYSQWLPYAGIAAAQPFRSPFWLGRYFEHLWLSLIRANPNYSCLYQDLQIFAHKRTLGSLDFLIKAHCSCETEHWEVAVKFYLQHDRHPDLFFGPNVKDRLDLKLKRMLEHQLPLAYSASANKLMTDLGISVPHRQRLILKGHLFRPLPQASVTDRFLWCTPEQFISFFPTDSVWVRLIKPMWLRPWQHQNVEALSRDELFSQSLTFHRAEMVTQIDTLGKEILRCFLVPGDWSEMAEASLYSE